MLGLAKKGLLYWVLRPSSAEIEFSLTLWGLILASRGRLNGRPAARPL